jgi:hypothetical protein
MIKKKKKRAGQCVGLFLFSHSVKYDIIYTGKSRQIETLFKAIIFQVHKGRKK